VLLRPRLLLLPLRVVVLLVLLVLLLVLLVLLLPQNLQIRHLLRPASTARTVRSTVCYSTGRSWCSKAVVGVGAHAFHTTRRELLRAVVPAGKGLPRGKSAVTKSTRRQHRAS
jgi:hypothetical protein